MSHLPAPQRPRVAPFRAFVVFPPARLGPGASGEVLDRSFWSLRKAESWLRHAVNVGACRVQLQAVQGARRLVLFEAWGPGERPTGKGVIGLPIFEGL